MYIITDYTKYQLSGSFQVFPSIKKGWRKTRKKNDLKISIIQGTKINIYITILTLTLNFVMFHFVTLTFILVENNTITLINVIVKCTLPFSFFSLNICLCIGFQNYPSLGFISDRLPYTVYTRLRGYRVYPPRRQS